MNESFVAQIIADGRITIPEKIRILLHLQEGDFVRVAVEKAMPIQKEVR